MPSIPQLDNCCFLCTLRTGCLIIGYVDIISCLVNGGLSIFNYVQVLQSSKENNEDLTIILSNYYATFMSVILGIIIGLLLVVGVYKKVKALLGLWMIISMFLILVNITTLIISLLNQSLILLYGFIFVGLQIYFLLVVYSYYREIFYTKKPEVHVNLYYQPANQEVPVPSSGV